MLKRRFDLRWLMVAPSLVVAAGLTLVLAAPARSQDSSQPTQKRGRKYTPPPETAHISVSVMKDTNGKPVQSAAVIFHIMEGAEKDKGNMELKTNEEGKAIIDVVPIGKTVRLQVIADGFQTFGDDYKITSDTKEIVVKLKRPTRQYSTYEHPADQAAGSSPQSGSGAPPKQ